MTLGDDNTLSRERMGYAAKDELLIKLELGIESTRKMIACSERNV